jgi:tetratricopeptide (TPR) repeat protein
MKLFKRDKDKEEDVRSILNKGIDFDLHGEHEKALSCYDKALKIKFFLFFINKGTALDYLARYTEALHYYDRALELAPENIDALVNKAVTLYNNSRQTNDEVLVICDQALKIQPYNARILYMKGTVLEARGKVSEAKAYLDKGSQLDPNFDNSLNDLQPMSKAVFEKPYHIMINSTM